jgi:hypothetical protein
VPGRCRAKAGSPQGRGHDVDSARNMRSSAHRDGGVAPRAPPVMRCPTCPLLLAVSRYWHGRAYLVEAVVRHAWTYRCAHTNQHVCDGVRGGERYFPVVRFFQECLRA